MQQYFQDSKFLLQIILDGYGLGKKDYTNAIYVAKTPYIDSLFKKYAHTTLFAHGQFVGLGNNTDLGGSEVGHSTIGAGRVLEQLPTRIQKMIQARSFEKSACLQKLFATAKNGALHLIGLLSDGNIHSNISHLLAIIQAAVQNKVSRCYLHALLDGRDTPIQSALNYTEQIEDLFAKINQQNVSFDYRFSSAGGREYTTMDRAKNWYLIERGWKAHIKAKADFCFGSVREGIEFFRNKNPHIIDQDLPVFTISSQTKKATPVKDNDAVFFFNFRADRAREFSSIWYNESFQHFDLNGKPNVFFASMSVYDQEQDQPKNRIIESLPKSKFLGEVLVERGIRQFRISETQKYPHVTFFYNGGYAVELDKKLETYCMINSNPPDTFAQKPAMKAFEITKQTIKFLESGDYRFGVVNFPNPDMVGHTGDFQAVVQAIEVVDQCLQMLCKKVLELGGIAMITADHGNADEMLVRIHQKEQASTKHSLNPVPFVIVENNFYRQYQLLQNSLQQPLSLSHIASTSLFLLNQQSHKDFDKNLFF